MLITMVNTGTTQNAFCIIQQAFFDIFHYIQIHRTFYSTFITAVTPGTIAF